MTKNPSRPISVLAIAGLYLTVGILGFSIHFRDLLAQRPDSGWVEATELVALVCGVFLYRGHNWARWLALAWMGFHVVLSSFHTYSEFIIHSILLVLIAGCLFNSEANRYFRKDESAA